MSKVDATTSKWIRTKADEVAAAQGCYFDEAAAQHVRAFFEKFLQIPRDGKSVPFRLLDWQWEQVIAPLFGWKRADGKRRFRQAYISVPKKNGKTILLAGLTLYMLLVDSGMGGECYSVATEREQAAMIYRECAKMVKASPELSALLTLVNTTKTIAFERRGSFYKALSAEANSQEGYNINFLCYDELHAAHNRELFDALRYAGIAKSEPLFVYITTAGYDRHSICYEQYQYAKKVNSGEVEDTAFFGFVAEAEQGDDWRDEKVWRKANPSFGLTIDAEQFRKDFNEALASPAKEASFRRYRLNQWTSASTRWIPVETWDRNAGAISPKDYAGRECYAGVDLASKSDLSALALLFPNDKGGYDILPYFWLPRDNVEDMSLRNGVSYLAWEKQGHIELTPGNVIDYDFIRKRINDLGTVYVIKEIAFDRFDATQLMGQLQDDGFTVVATSQGIGSISSPAKEFARLLRAGKMNHGNNPVLRWMAGNVEVKVDENDNIKPVKAGSKHSPSKIDGVVAGIMALDRAMRHKATSGSVYDKEDRGLVVI